MAKKQDAVKPLTGEQLQEILGLLKGADSIELKLTIPEQDQRSAIVSLGMDPLDAQMRQIVFFDTPNLDLNQAGVVVRARRVQGKGDDSVVKLRPVVPNELSPDLRKSPDFVVEVDAIPGGFVCSGSYKASWGPAAVKNVLFGDRPIRKLFSDGQRDYYKAHAPDGIGLDDLEPLGPITALKLKFQPKDFARPMVAELWFYPDGSRILELSTKALPNEGFQAVAEARAFLSSKGIDLSGEQQTKTKTALEYYSRIRGAKKD
jgi:hypothetical protein